ncbi:MAG TPA: cytochrome o ubiquinol oxidase subunit IV [Candidatus Paceibacterota bacterium]|nr:cytochrome o ubiquinol oxidase subunit IV [Candidatus Paceibacterota bacterium]
MNAARKYIVGYTICVAITLCAFLLAQIYGQTQSEFPTREMLVAALVGLAVLQFIIQIVYFLHLGEEEKPRWNLAAFSFALIVVVILVGGSLWIMNHLEHNLHTNMFEEENIPPQILQ